MYDIKDRQTLNVRHQKSVNVVYLLVQKIEKPTPTDLELVGFDRSDQI